MKRYVEIESPTPTQVKTFESNMRKLWDNGHNKNGDILAAAMFGFDCSTKTAALDLLSENHCPYLPQASLDDLVKLVDCLPGQETLETLDWSSMQPPRDLCLPHLGPATALTLEVSDDNNTTNNGSAGSCKKAAGTEVVDTTSNGSTSKGSTSGGPTKVTLSNDLSGTFAKSMGRLAAGGQPVRGGLQLNDPSALADVGIASLLTSCPRTSATPTSIFDPFVATKCLDLGPPAASNTCALETLLNQQMLKAVQEAGRY